MAIAVWANIGCAVFVSPPVITAVFREASAYTGDIVHIDWTAENAETVTINGEVQVSSVSGTYEMVFGSPGAFTVNCVAENAGGSDTDIPGIAILNSMPTLSTFAITWKPTILAVSPTEIWGVRSSLSDGKTGDVYRVNKVTKNVITQAVITGATGSRYVADVKANSSFVYVLVKGPDADCGLYRFNFDGTQAGFTEISANNGACFLQCDETAVYTLGIGYDPAPASTSRRSDINKYDVDGGFVSTTNITITSLGWYLSEDSYHHNMFSLTDYLYCDFQKSWYDWKSYKIDTGLASVVADNVLVVNTDTTSTDQPMGIIHNLNKLYYYRDGYEQFFVKDKVSSVVTAGVDYTQGGYNFEDGQMYFSNLRDEVIMIAGATNWGFKAYFCDKETLDVNFNFNTESYVKPTAAIDDAYGNCVWIGAEGGLFRYGL